MIDESEAHTSAPILHTSRKPSLRLLDYYVIEGINSFAVFLFLMTIFFWAREKFGFSNIENLILGAVQGVCYIVSSRVLGLLSDRLGYNRMIVIALIGMAAVTLTAWIPDWRGMPYLAIIPYVIFMGGTWPVLEAGAMHLPGKLNMPQRLGIYNLVWSTTGALGFIFSGFVFVLDPDSILWITGCLHLFQLAWIFYHRGRHKIVGSTAMEFAHEGDRHPASVKEYLKNLSWISNSLGYFIAGAFSALTPHIGEALGLTQSWTIWLGCSLIASRALSFILLWKWEGWHYRKVWSHVALWSAPLFLAVAFFSKQPWLVAFACILLGFSLGLSYYKSIYYSLDSSDNKGEQGGLHEAIIGIGILLGPLVGAVGGYLTGSTFGAKATIVIGAVVLSIAGLLWLNRPKQRVA